MLSDGDESRLMVSSGVDGSETVDTSGETVSNISSQDTVSGLVVQTLEEGETSGVGGVGLGQGLQLLNNDVRVTLDITSTVNLLRSSEVVLLSVGEESSLEVVDGHRDGERGVGLDGIAVLGVLELGGRHVGLSSDDTHGCRVAGAGLDLLTIRKRKVGNSQTEVDEVVRRSERSNLTSGGSDKVGELIVLSFLQLVRHSLVLTIVSEAFGDDIRVKGCKENMMNTCHLSDTSRVENLLKEV